MGGQLKKPPCMSWTSYLRSKHFSECRCRRCIKSRTLFGDSFLRLPPRLKVITQVFPIYSPPELGLFCPYTPNRPRVQLDYLDHIAHNLLPHQVRKPYRITSTLIVAQQRSPAVQQRGVCSDLESFSTAIKGTLYIWIYWTIGRALSNLEILFQALYVCSLLVSCVTEYSWN